MEGAAWRLPPLVSLKKKKYGAASSLISNEVGVLRTSSKEDLAGDKTRGFCSGFMGTFPLWGLLELVSG